MLGFFLVGRSFLVCVGCGLGFFGFFWLGFLFLAFGCMVCLDFVILTLFLAAGTLLVVEVLKV